MSPLYAVSLCKFPTCQSHRFWIRLNLMYINNKITKTEVYLVFHITFTRMKYCNPRNVFRSITKHWPSITWLNRFRPQTLTWPICSNSQGARIYLGNFIWVSIPIHQFALRFMTHSDFITYQFPAVYWTR